MKTAIHFFLTCFVSCIVMLGADVKHIVPMYMIAAGLCVLFFLAQKRRVKRIRARQRRAYLFEQYLRMQLRKGGCRY